MAVWLGGKSDLGLVYIIGLRLIQRSKEHDPRLLSVLFLETMR